MARASVLDESAYANLSRTEAHANKQTAVGKSRIEHLLRFVAPLLASIFCLLLVAAGVIGVINIREQTYVQSASDLELTTASAAIAYDRTRRSDASILTDLLETIARRHASGISIVVADAAGDIVAAFPQELAKGTVGEQIGDAQPLAILGEKAGVIRARLADGREALAAAHSLPSSSGQIYAFRSFYDMDSQWRRGAMLPGISAALAVVTIAAFAFAWFAQAARAHRAVGHCEQLGRKFEMALNRGHCGLWDWDLSRGRIMWSDSMYDLLGMEPDGGSLSVGDLSAVIHPADLNLAVVAKLMLVSDRRTIDRTFRARHRDGRWLWLRARAEIVRQGAAQMPHLIGIALDISEHRSLAEKSRTAGARLQEAIESTSETFVLWDAQDRLVACNARFMKLYGLPPGSDREGVSVEDFLAQATMPIVAAHAREADGVGARTYEAQLADGRWLQFNERATRDGGYVSVGSDITPHKLHEEKLLDSERRLMATVADLRKSRQTLEVQARQLADMAERYLEQKAEAELANSVKSDFLANMSHELRTPLNAIIGFSQIMEHETFGALGCSKYIDYACHIRESGQHLLGVIADVLEMSSLEAGRVALQRSEFEIDQTLATVVERVEDSAASKNITVVSQGCPGIHVSADRDAIERILGKLLRNAIRFTPVGGKIALRSRLIDGAINIYVADNGCGIAADAMARIGRPFEQINAPLENGYKGSGLGLAIARSIAELHGGALRIRSAESRGTLVRVRLPLPPSALQATARPPRHAVRIRETA